MKPFKALGPPALALALLAAGLGLAAGFFLGRARPPGSGAGAPAADTRQYTCGMHPQVIQTGPGVCPICHMKLTPIDAQGTPQDNAIAIDPVIVQNMGLRVDTVTEGPLQRTVRAPGYFHEAESARRDVSLKVDGWVQQLFADTEGMHLTKDSALLELYSPAVLAAQAEVIAARRALEGLTTADPVPRKEAERVLEIAKEKLRLWDVAPADVEAIALEPKPRATVLIRSPMEGHLIAKKVVTGSAVKAGEPIFRIVDHSILWVDALVYERDLPFVTTGGPATVTVLSLPGKVFRGHVFLLHPHVDEMTRAATARIAVKNPAFELRPGMYATVQFPMQAVEKTVLAPREAVIDTGERHVAFVALDGGRFEPRTVRMGLEGDEGVVQILWGLKPGESVVTSGQFLLDAESRVREARRKYLDEGRLKTAPAAARGESAPLPELPPAERDRITPPAGALLARYLDLARALARDEEEVAAAAGRDLLPLAKELRTGASQTALEPTAGELERAAKAIQGKPLAELRKGLRPLSDALITIVKRVPAAAKRTPGLKVIHCPMYPGSWLQTADEVTNPYYGAKMLRCGEVVFEVAPAEGVRQPVAERSGGKG